MSKYAGKIVLISGGAGGIGLAVAERFGRAGAHIALADINAADVDTHSKRLRQTGIDCRDFKTDVTCLEACQRLVSEVLQWHGSLDVLIHCAGITQVSSFLQTQLAVYRRVMEVNFFGAVTLTQAAIEPLLASRGHIVVLSSIAGFAPLLGRTGYCASKYAVHGFFETLRGELSDLGVRVTLVCPSFVETEFASRGLKGDGSRIDFARSTTGGVLSADYVAQSIYHACVRNRRQIVLSPLGKLSYFMTRFAPACYDHLMRRRFQSEMRRNQGG
ncbi:MAG: SDR family oxidoreductase [Pirellulaceae bacterium]|nr:SDR family oxidoreductase [Pirellulaceae bacterium]